MKSDVNFDSIADGSANEDRKGDLSSRLEKLLEAIANPPPRPRARKPLFSDDELLELRAREQAPKGSTTAQIRRTIKPRYLRQ